MIKLIIDNLLIFVLVFVLVFGAFSIGWYFYQLVEYIIDKIKSPKYNLWIKYQPNPLGRNTLDCSIRAISKIFSVTWTEALDLIVACAKKYSEQTNCSANLNTLLYEKQHMHVYEPKKKMTFEKFAYLHPTGTYALYSKGHICACVNGKLYDSWNSSCDKLLFYCTQVDDKIKDKDITFTPANECKNNVRFGFDD